MKMTKSLTKKLSTKTRIGLGLLALAVLILVGKPLLQSNDLTASSVTVTNIAGTSGGTGIILSSSETSSTILTNSHVCKVVEKGGLVTGRAGSFLVATYKHSNSHDLCLITVDGNLRTSTKIAAKAPIPYYENALISGHPGLMPNVITGGHFSGRKVIAVMRGIKPCTEEQKADPGTALLCLLVGGVPDVNQYDSTLVTATIMPGSSGSGVYNENKELAGVAFAGSGNLGYAWTVPFESMKNFIDKEAATLEAKRPDNTLGASIAGGEKKGTSESILMQKLKDTCATPNKEKLRDFCQLVDDDIVWHK